MYFYFHSGMIDKEFIFNKDIFEEATLCNTISIGSIKMHVASLEDQSQSFFNLESNIDDLLEKSSIEVEDAKLYLDSTFIEFNHKFISLLDDEVKSLKAFFVRGDLNSNIYEDLLKHRTILQMINKSIEKLESDEVAAISSRKDLEGFLKRIYSDDKFISKIANLVSTKLLIDDFKILKEVYVLSIKEIYKFYNISQEHEICYFYGSRELIELDDLYETETVYSAFVNSQLVEDDLLNFIFKQRQLSSKGGAEFLLNQQRRQKELVRN